MTLLVDAALAVLILAGALFLASVGMTLIKEVKKSSGEKNNDDDKKAS